MPGIFSLFNSVTGKSTPTTTALQGGVGELAPLDLDPFNLTLLKYPQEISTPDAPHYVRFDINIPDSSKYISNAQGQLIYGTSSAKSAAQQNADLNGKAGAINMTGDNIFDAGVAGGAAAGLATVASSFGSDPISALGSGLAQGAVTGLGIGVAGKIAQQTNITVKPKTVRTSTSISLYMPDTVTTAYDHNWNALSLTDALGRLGQASAYGSSLNISGIKDALIKDIANSWKNKEISTVNTRQAYNNAKFPVEAAGELAQATGAVGGDFTTFLLKNQGLAVNPHLEMTFQSTQNRRYVFEFDFQPRSQKEAQNIQQIIQYFRAYAAPELAEEKQSNNGRYFIPPAEFDISYRFGNVENPYIAKISTCALTSIAINWNQSGAFATFKDGAPVHIHMALTFVEVDIIYRDLIATKGY